MNTGRRKIMIAYDNIADWSSGIDLLQSLYDILSVSSAEKMFQSLETSQPDLMLLDTTIPDMGGYEALRKLRSNARFSDVPIIILTASGDDGGALRGIELNGVDCLTKPLSLPLLLKHIEQHFLIARQQQMMRFQADNLSTLINAKVKEVFDLQNAVLKTVADLVEFRDKYTGGHIARTQLYMQELIEGMIEKKIYTDELSRWNMEFILPSTQLHDVGKIGISDVILNKPDKLTPEEYEIMKTHVLIGVDAVRRIMSNTREHDFLRHALNIVGAHHEKWDGTGYPAGLKGESIPLEGRLMAIADVYDALISSRPYKPAYSHQEAVAVIEYSSGTHFDPLLVDVFRDVKGSFPKIVRDHAV